MHTVEHDGVVVKTQSLGAGRVVRATGAQTSTVWPANPRPSPFWHRMSISWFLLRQAGGIVLEVEENMSPDELQIRDVHLTWINAVNDGDLERLLALMTDDVVFINPGKDPFGREGFRATFTTAPQRKALIHCISELEEVIVAGDVAYTRSRDSLSVTPRGGADASHFAGYRISVYRKQSDGRWLMARDAHTLSRVDK